MPREKKLKLFEVMIDGGNISDDATSIYVKAFTKSQAIAFARPSVTARELGAVEAIGIPTADVKDVTNG